MIDVTLLSFFVLAVASVASALGVIFFKNAVHSALSLILTLLFLALFYLQLGAMFIAIVQVLIYAGAIMVLFLFVVTIWSRKPAITSSGIAFPGSVASPPLWESYWLAR